MNIFNFFYKKNLRQSHALSKQVKHLGSELSVFEFFLIKDTS